MKEEKNTLGEGWPFLLKARHSFFRVDEQGDKLDIKIGIVTLHFRKIDK